MRFYPSTLPTRQRTAPIIYHILPPVRRYDSRTRLYFPIFSSQTITLDGNNIENLPLASYAALHRVNPEHVSSAQDGM